MKIYKKFKNFIPDSFYIKYLGHKNKHQNILISIFLIFNLILLPCNLKKINDVNKKEVKFNDYESYSDKGRFKIVTVMNAVDELFDDEFEEVYVNNNCGEALIQNLNILNSISESGVLDVNRVDFVGNEKYKIGVNINEQ